MPGGRIAPDGRQPRPPGVGKTARRHDLEAQPTPGLHNSDLQQGDVSMLENGQRVAPRPKKSQPSAAPQSRGKAPARQQAPGPMQVPDPIEFASQRVGGGVPAPNEQGEIFDAERWRPLMAAIARNPLASGPLTTTLMTQLSNMSRQVNTASVQVIDQNAADEAVRRSL